MVNFAWPPVLVLFLIPDVWMVILGLQSKPTSRSLRC